MARSMLCRVPPGGAGLAVRSTFHTALMRVNGPVIQTLMALAVLSSLVLGSIEVPGSAGQLGGACTLQIHLILVTRFGDVPIS